MAPPDWAYHVDNFESPPDDELICSICRGVFCDPVQCPCNHVFCRNCIHMWLDRNRNCPICRKRTTKYTVQEVVPLIKNMIMKLTVLCHNKDKGCPSKFALEGYEPHLKICLYETVKCENCSCQQEMLRKDIQDHGLNCPHRSITCEVCSLKGSSDGQQHSCIQELKRMLKEKDLQLEKSNQEIKKLQREVKLLKENAHDSSDSASIESVSSAEIMIGLNNIPDLSPASSLVSESDDEDNSSYWLDQPDTPASPTEEADGYNQDSSVEYPRSASSFVRVERDPIVDILSGATFGEEPIRRPPKRRHSSQTVSSTDDDQDLEVTSLPSPKRSWRPTDRETAGPSQGPSDVDSLNGSYSTLPNRERRKINSRVRTSTSEDRLSSRQNSSPVFESTLALLAQYNLESDPEWLPGPAFSDNGSEPSGDRSFNGLVSSSDESSTSSSDSSDRSRSGEQNATRDFFFSVSESSSSDGDDYWRPF